MSDRRPGSRATLRERGVEDVYLCGLARDVCVKWTAEDTVAAGLRTHLLWDLTRSVDPEGDEAVRAEREEAGVEITDSGALEA